MKLTVSAKNLTKLVLFLFFTFHLSLFTFAQGVSISETNAVADPSAMFEVSSNSKGLLVPRMTTAERNAIVAPIESLLIFNTDTKCFEAYYATSSAWVAFGCIGPQLEPGDVYSPSTGRIWMDRNLGASRVATSSTDALSYGDLYQWGRAADGHQIRTSTTTSTLSTTDTPGHSNFITNSSSPSDWRSPQNNNLWQGVSGVNNPCPSGYRLPISAEWDAERSSWSSNDLAGAFASPLKLPVAGRRWYINGSLVNEGSSGHYWLSDLDGYGSRSLYINSNVTSWSSNVRAYGCSVRCIKVE